MYKNIERQIVKIEPVQKRDYEEPIAFREVPLGCTSLTIYMDYAVFVSDNRKAVFEQNQNYFTEHQFHGNQRVVKMISLISWGLYKSVWSSFLYKYKMNLKKSRFFTQDWFISFCVFNVNINFQARISMSPSIQVMHTAFFVSPINWNKSMKQTFSYFLAY